MTIFQMLFFYISTSWIVRLVSSLRPRRYRHHRRRRRASAFVCTAASRAQEAPRPRRTSGNFCRHEGAANPRRGYKIEQLS